VTLQVPKVIPNDWTRLRIIIDKLKHLRLGQQSNPTFNSITLTGLTASRLVATDANKEFESVPGTSVHPEFEGITIKNSDGDIIFYVDDDEMYFTALVVIPIEAGMPMGLLLALTYAAP
jgi:hypothetical protein